MPEMLVDPARSSAVRQAFASCRPAFLRVGVFSAAINVLLLSGSLYMLQVYDRVLSSRSEATLIALSVILLFAYGLHGMLDNLRIRMLSRIGAKFDSLLSHRVFHAGVGLPLRGGSFIHAGQGLKDLDQIRNFMSGIGPTALLDAPFMPVFLLGCFLLHPLFGLLTVVGGAIIVALALRTEAASRTPGQAAAAIGSARSVLVEASRRNLEAVRAMGMGDALERRFLDLNGQLVQRGLDAADAVSGLGSLAKTFRLVLQSAVLGLGAYLALHGDVSPGAMIAASILTSRALAPLELAVSHWRGFLAARQSFRRLDLLVATLEGDRRHYPLPAPHRELSICDLSLVPPGAREPVLSQVSLRVAAGQALAVIGPSASGKTTLVRAIVGVWQPQQGEVRLDGAALDMWDPGVLGGHVGYLPQDVELFDGTVAQNIARFRPEADPGAVLAAANAAGAHDMIVRLPDGYRTRIGDGGASLSGGQRQRIGLARALFGDPFLVVLDEPNAHLDGQGDEALVRAIQSVRARGGIVVVVTHRPAALAGVDLVAMLRNGELQAFGPRESVLQKVLRGGLHAVPRPAAIGDARP